MAWDLKNEEEVKQYLDNLGTEYRFGCLSEKKPEGEILAFMTKIIFIVMTS
jgi:hypothetical protein